MPEEVDNAALFLRLGIPSIENTSSNWKNLKTPTLGFSVDGKHFEKRAFRKSWRTISPLVRVFLKLKHVKRKMSSDFCVFKFLLWNVDEAFSS